MRKHPKAIAVDHRDDRLRVIPQRAAAPFDRHLPNRLVFRRLVLQRNEELLEVHAGAKGITCPGNDERLGFLVIT